MVLPEHIESRIAMYQATSYSSFGEDHELTVGLSKLMSEFCNKKEGLTPAALEDINKILVSITIKILTLEKAEAFQKDPTLFEPYLKRIIDEVPKLMIEN